MSKNVKIRKKMINKKISINYKRFALACVVSLSTLLCMVMLINKIIKKESIEAKNSRPSPQAKTSQSSSLPQIQPTISYPFSEQPILENKGIIETNKQPVQQNLPFNNNNYGTVSEYNHNMKLIPALDYQGVQSTINYNKTTPPNWIFNSQLQQIVNEIVNNVISQGLPSENLSISLINLNSVNCCEYAGYSDGTARFAASITKLYWMVYLYGLYEAGTLNQGEVPEKAVRKMIEDSDNKYASLIVDKVTQTKSGDNLPENEFKKWYQKRLGLNQFFIKAGYNPINISQKLFPYDDNYEPQGRDLQIRKDDVYPIRNHTTTHDIARLLLEIEREESISKQYSLKMKKILKRSLKKENWQNKQFNAIEGFLGEYLPEQVNFFSKMGWNSTTRNDAAIIHSPDGKNKYILVIFGDDPGFYKNKTIFPKISRMVYQKMTEKNQTWKISSRQQIKTENTSETNGNQKSRANAQNTSPAPLGWMWLGNINNTTNDFSWGDKLISSQRQPVSITPGVVPSPGAVVTIQNPTNIRDNLPQPPLFKLPLRVAEPLTPGEKVVILQVKSYVDNNSSSKNTRIWAQIGKP